MAKKILLADDSLTIQKVVELTFSDGDYDLVCVSNGQKALDKVRDDRPDLILADVVMPEKNGYEVCEAIKGNPATARIPVVLLSGTFEPFDRDRAERIGCDAIVSKPFDSQQLISQVEGLLGKARAETPEPEPLDEPGPAAGASPDSERGPFDSGFSSEDFTASVRVSARPERFDPFEEEYGREDADAAILAFEKAHPEFAGASGGGGESEASLRGESPADAPWLIEEPEPVSPPQSPAAASRAGIWSPPEEEPDRPLDFDAERTGSSRPRADEGPTQEIPHQAFRPAGSPPIYPSEPRAAVAGDLPDASFEARRRPWETPEPEEISADDAEALFDVGTSDDGDEEEDVIGMPTFSAAGGDRTEELATSGGMTDASGSGEAEPHAEPEAQEAAPADARELEALAQTASIPELTTMLSSVMRSGGELSDAEIDRLAQRVVEKLSDRIVREIAWEVIPDMAEIVIKERIKELESGVE